MGNIQDIKNVSIRIQEAINSFETIIPSDNELNRTLKTLRNDFNYLNSEVQNWSTSWNRQTAGRTSFQK